MIAMRPPDPAVIKQAERADPIPRGPPCPRKSAPSSSISAEGRLGDQAGRVARSRPRRGRRQGHRDLAQSRRDAAGVAGRRAGLAAGLGFRRCGRARGGRRQRAEARHAGRRPPAVGRLGRAGQLPQPCGRGSARRGQRRAGRDLAGRRPDRACMRCARAGCCSAARCWSTAPRAGSGISPASSPRGRRAGLGPCAPGGIPRRGRRMVRRAGRARPRSLAPRRRTGRSG